LAFEIENNQAKSVFEGTPFRFAVSASETRGSDRRCRARAETGDGEWGSRRIGDEGKERRQTTEDGRRKVEASGVRDRGSAKRRRMGAGNPSLRRGDEVVNETSGYGLDAVGQGIGLFSS